MIIGDVCAFVGHARVWPILWFTALSPVFIFFSIIFVGASLYAFLSLIVMGFGFLLVGVGKAATWIGERVIGGWSIFSEWLMPDDY